MSESTSANNKRIAKNTLLLYVRLLFSMSVGLFTSRVILNTLGIDDYGVYNVVAGVVSMFSLFSNSLSNAISRYIAFELGKKDAKRLSEVFSTSVTIQIVLAIVIVVIVELLGVWFLNSHLNIPKDRLYAANWAMHMAILVFAINLISVPYNAAIIAHEKMSVFAYISILEVTLKLIVAYVLYISSFDKLITYSVLLVFVAIVIRLIYGTYCNKHFQECHYQLVYDKSLLKEMLGFAGWNVLGSGAYLFNTQGVNIVTNMYFNVAANAARGVATQAGAVIKQFVNNLTVSINPQITKSYASGNLQYMYSLVCRSARFGYLLMLLFAIPFLFETEFIMFVWLKNYPPEAPLFFRLSLIGSMIDFLGNSPAVAAWATGNIRKYYIWVSAVGCLVFPLSWLAFAMGMPAYTAYIVFIVVYLLVLLVKLFFVRELVKMPLKLYFKDVVIRIVGTTCLSVPLPLMLYMLLPRTIMSSVAVIVIGVISVCFSIYLLGVSQSERNKIVSVAKSKIEKWI